MQHRPASSRVAPARTSRWLAALSLALSSPLLAPMPASAADAPTPGATTPMPPTFMRRVAADPAGSVTIGNVAGSVRVDAWDRAEVQVDAKVGSGVERIDVLRDGARVVVKVVLPRVSGFSRSGATMLQVKVPRSSKLEISRVSAEVETHGVRGAQRVSSVSGNVGLDLEAAPAEVRTVSGDVNLRGTGQSASSRITTVSGDVRVERSGGVLEATTVSGDLALGLGSLQSLRLRSTSGDVRLQGAPERGASLEAESVSGDIEMALRAAAGFELEAESFSGDIGSCFGATGAPSRGMGPGTALRATRGDGGARVRIKTMSGDIEVCDR